MSSCLHVCTKHWQFCEKYYSCLSTTTNTQDCVAMMIFVVTTHVEILLRRRKKVSVCLSLGKQCKLNIFILASQTCASLPCTITQGWKIIDLATDVQNNNLKILSPQNLHNLLTLNLHKNSVSSWCLFNLLIYLFGSPNYKIQIDVNNVSKNINLVYKET